MALPFLVPIIGAALNTPPPMSCAQLPPVLGAGVWIRNIKHPEEADIDILRPPAASHRHATRPAHAAYMGSETQVRAHI